MIDDRLRFSPSDQLSPSQIKSYFSRLTNDRRRKSQSSVQTRSSGSGATTLQNSNNSDPTDYEQEDEDDEAFDSLLQELNRQEIRLEIKTFLGADSLE